MKKLFVLLLTFIIILNSFIVAYAQQAMNLELGKFKLPDKWIYEGVTFSEDYATKRYTLITNLDVYILYGNRDLYEEIQKKMPIFSKDDIEKKLTTQNFAEIISGAAGSSCEEKLYGKNIFYEFEKAQQVKGTNKIVNSVIDMYFRDGYVHSFSYSYKTSKDNFQDYQNMLANFRLATDPEPETKPKTQEPAKTEVVSDPTPAVTEVVVEPVQNPQEVTPETPVAEPTPEVTQEPTTPVEPTIEPKEPVSTPNENTVNDTPTNVQDTKNSSEEPTEPNNQVPVEVTTEPNNDETNVEVVEPSEPIENLDIEGQGNNEQTDISYNSENITPAEATRIDQIADNEPEEEIENVVPVTLSKSKPMAIAILGIPAVRDTLIILVILDIIIAILAKRHHNKKKAKAAEMQKQAEQNNEKAPAKEEAKVEQAEAVKEEKVEATTESTENKE